MNETYQDLEKKELTYGEKAVGLSFNPSNRLDVQDTKIAYAHIIDTMNDLKNNTSDPEVKRLASIAITEAQTAQMWAIKALTYNS